MSPEEFQRELTAIGGVNPFGRPVLRVVDGRREEKWEGGGWVLKYPVITNRRQGFEYRDDEGRTQFVEDPADVPRGKLCVDAFRQDEHGEEVYIVERWRSAEFLASTGRFDDSLRRDEEGSELIRERPSEGHYDFMLRLQDKQARPLPLVPAALELVRALIADEQQHTPAERARLDEEFRLKQEGEMEAAKRERKNALWGFDPDDYRPVLTSAGHTRFEKKVRHV